MEGPRRIDFKSITWNSPATGVRSKVYQQDGKQLRLVEFTREFVEPDWCMKGHTGFVLKGELEIDFNGSPVVFRPGDGLFIPPGEAGKHKARALTATAQLILVEDL